MALTDQEKSFLPAEGEGAPLDGSGMNRSSSSRFHVENIVEPNSVELNNTNPRKPSDSSNGRFQVAPHDPPSNNPAGKAVHFSVGDEHKPHRQDSSSTIENNTINHKSFRNVQTLEKPPIIDFYLNSSDADGGMVTRPSMIALLTGRPNEVVTLELDEFKSQNDEIFDGQGLAESRLEKFKPPPSSAARVKFGWIEGVFVRCLLNILGVMLYLRISWVAGQAGLILGSAIVLLASTVTTITAISMCAICTNGDVKGGGAYFLISRSLGPEFGGSIGLIFSVANAVGAAMYVVGFAETVRDLMVEQGWKIIDNDVMDVRIIGLVTCTLLMAIVFIGTSFESRMQIGLLAILTVSIVNYWVGTFIPIKEVKRGVTGYSFTTMMTNMLPAFRGEDFFSVFAVYFPAATGIMAGANISGDLADPQKSIPKGTLWAILGTTILYLSTVWLTGTTCVRDAMEYGAPLLANGSWEWLSPPCALNNTCPYGLLNYFQVMKIESGWGPLITAGIFAATLSSALASLVSAPKVFQAVCKDRLFPYIHFFAKGYGKDEEPRRAYALGFAIAMLMILIGDLNAIAPIISNFFLASYALINYACFDASFADSPGFRPSFKYYNMWLSLGGALLCLTVMFIISWWTALVTFLFFAMFFLYVLHRKPEVNWGSSTQAHSYKSALQAMLKLTTIEEHVKNFRPQLLVLTGNPAARPSLVDFVNNITKGSSLMICGHVIPYAPSDRVFSCIRKLDRQLNEWLHKRHVKAFYVSTANASVRAGVQTLLHLAGLGKLRPNIVIIGFKGNWAEDGADGLDEINEYFGIIQDSFDSNMGVGIMRNAGGGLDYSELMKEHNVGDTTKLKLPDVNAPLTAKSSVDLQTSDHGLTGESSALLSPVHELSKEDLARGGSIKPDLSESASSFAEKFPFLEEGAVEDVEDEEETFDVSPTAEEDHKENRTSPDGNGSTTDSPLRRLSLRARRPTAAQRDLVASINRFQRKIKSAVVDVWWLYDDGGLTLLIPHLLTVPKSYLENAKMRVFTIASSRSAIEQEQRSMAALLSKFRIEFTDVFVIPDIAKRPSPSTLAEWEQLIAPFRVDDDSGNHGEGLISPAELTAHKERTYRQLRCRELLLDHSSQANLVVMTLPVPRKGIINSCLYMAWLEMLTRDLPPTLLIRGNQTSVLTFYS